MTKLIHICASANDLFGLDDEGVVYRYNCNTEGWMRLGRGRASDAASEREEKPEKLAPAPPP